MFKGTLTVVERFIWAMISIIVILIVAFWILGVAENKGNGNFIGNIAQWINDRARPQAS